MIEMPSWGLLLKHVARILGVSILGIQYAQAQTAAVDASPVSGLVQFLPIIVLVIVSYFMMLRPQAKRQKAMREMISGLSKNDEVVTTGGLAGRVVELGETYLSLEIAKNGDKSVEITVQRNAIQTVLPKGSLGDLITGKAKK